MPLRHIRMTLQLIRIFSGLSFFCIFWSVILLQSCTTVHTSMDRKRRLQLVEAALLLDDDLNEAIDDLRAVQEADAPGERRRKRKRWWVRPWILRRPLFGQYEQLMVELSKFLPTRPNTLTIVQTMLTNVQNALRSKKGPSDQQPTKSRIASD